MIKEILLVGLGGGIGSILRFLTSKLALKIHPGDFPLGTFCVNILGCFLIGLLLGLSIKHEWLSLQGKYLLITGFCGGFTTFSTFSMENLYLYQSGNYAMLIIYTAASLIIGFGAVWGGLLLAR